MKNQTTTQDKVVREVRNVIDYLWLMRCFEEELAKEADSFREAISPHHEEHRKLIQKFLKTQ